MKPRLHPIHPQNSHQKHPPKHIHIARLRITQRPREVQIINDKMLLIRPRNGKIKGAGRIPQVRREIPGMVESQLPVAVQLHIPLEQLVDLDEIERE